MTLNELLEKEDIFKSEVISDGGREIKSVYCCDLLSIVMGRAKAGCAWVTVMGNVNAAALFTLADMSCIVLAENAVLDAVARKKSAEQGVNVIRTALPVFQAAMVINERLKNNN